MQNCLIIPAGGMGKRFGSELPKQFHKLDDIPLIIRTIRAFLQEKSITDIVIATPADYIEELDILVDDYEVGIPVKIIEGGAERQDSVYNALKTEEAKGSELVLIHDAVRPFVSRGLIKKLIDTAREIGGAVPGLMPKETIREKQLDGNYKTLTRNNLFSIQTPQVFNSKKIYDAFEKAVAQNYYSTDDAAVFEFAGYDYLIVEGEETNLKITSRNDFLLAEYYLKSINL